MLVVAALGVKLSARFQWGWAIFEYGLLVGFTVAAIVAIYGHHLHHAVHLTSSWFTLSGAGGFKALISGVLLAIFLYSGWDTAAYVGEETEGRKAGSAAVTSVVILFVMYAVVIMAFQGVAPSHVLQNHAANILAYVGQLLGGGFWKQVMIVAVLGGTLASLQAAIVSSSRISFAMGRDRVFPRWFGAVSSKHRTPVERHHPARAAERGVPVGLHADRPDRPGAGRHREYPRPDGGHLLPAHRRHRGLVLPPHDHAAARPPSSSAACCPAWAPRSWRS